MAVDESPRSEPDNTFTLVANDGTILDQEQGTGKLILRRGAGSDQADIDVGTKANPHDLANGDFESGTKKCGGAEALAADIFHQDSGTFSIEIDWLDDDGNVTGTKAPPALTDVDGDTDFNLVMRSDSFEVRITDTSGDAQNRINGTINAH